MDFFYIYDICLFSDFFQSADSNSALKVIEFMIRVRNRILVKFTSITFYRNIRSR